ncbi:MAG: DEAD/DEAH box helicase family protein, partial [Candidatus Marinimicrobia bacterium]|nr:DEAD/DEAH box helicase family protein [Candidatus Neomarinimicrobiota bacterium]
MYAEIAFPISSYQTFTYKVPESLDSHIQVGIRVRAPFGNRMVQGLVVATHKATDFKGTLKEINDIVDDQRILDHNLWKLIQWMSKYYMTPIGQVARTILPSKLSTKYQPQKQWMVQQSTMAPDWSLIKNAPVQTLLLKAILQKKEICPVSEFGLLTSSPLTVCRALSDKGLVLLSEQILIPDATGFTFKPLDKTLNFSASQKEVLHDIEAGMVSNKYSPFVLHGVTGSGKTEIYIAAVQHALDNGKTAIVLLPEISLTPQIGGRFRSAFGDSVGLWHSKMSPALRAWTWKRMCSGDFKVIVGARSAIFAPLKNLGLIVVDEEQESSYKQES